MKVGQSAVCFHTNGKKTRANVTALFSHEGLEKIQVESAAEGDIVGIAGFEDVFIGETITDNEEREALPFVHIDPPTITMKICVNDSPLAGRDGKLLTARQIKDRLIRETRTNVSLQVSETETAGHFEVKARGEMQIAILVEQMRREGFEILVSRPEVIFKRAEDGSLLEPMETLYVDVPGENLGDILQSLAGRKAEIVNMQHNPHNVLVEATIPTRGLIGFETDLVNVTKGHGIASHLFKEYGPHKGDIPSRGKGVLVSMEGGISMAYALDSIQERGRLFIGPQEEIYKGMIVGENARPDDMPVNPCKAKKLTNMRSQGDGKGISLASAAPHEPRALSRIHRARRIRRGHAKVPAPAKEDPRCHRSQARCRERWRIQPPELLSQSLIPRVQKLTGLAPQSMSKKIPISVPQQPLQSPFSLTHQ